MFLRFTPYMIPLLLACLLGAFMVRVAWQRRDSQGAIPFLFLEISILIYGFFYMLELGSLQTETGVFLARIQYFGLATIGANWLWLALAYTGKTRWLNKRNLAILFVIPLITILLVWTNNFHQLIWQTVEIDTSLGLARWQATYGAWFWVYLSYTYGTLFVGSVVIVRALFQSPEAYRSHIWALLVAAIAPWVANVVALVGNPFFLNPTPFMLSLAGITMAWAMFGSTFLDLMPVARETVLETMGDAVLVFDRQQRLVDINPSGEAMLGQSAKVMIGQPLETLFETIPAWMLQPNGLGEIHREQDGKTQIYAGQANGFYSRRGLLRGIVLTLRNITYLKETEDALRLARDEAQAADRAKTTFLAMMSHELRTPLTVIMGYADLVKEVLEEEQGDAYLIEKMENINKSGQHLLAIVSDVLDIAKLEAGQIELHWLDIDMDMFMQDIVQTAVHFTSLSNNQLETDIGVLGKWQTDPTQLKRVLTNLIENGIKFTEAGMIRLTAVRHTEQLIIEVQDTGIGMSPEQTEHLFQPFMQADSSASRRFEGAGLGLALSQRLAQLLGGNITVKSQLGKGSTFTLTLTISNW